jgi:hypothetical protein
VVAGGADGSSQRPFLPAPILALANVCVVAKGEAFADDFGFSALGFLFSRLPLCSRFATADLLRCWVLVKRLLDQQSVFVACAPSTSERRAKSSSTLAISVCLRGSCATGVAAKTLSR